MHERLVTRYATSSTEAADENQRRVEAVFDENAAAPENVQDHGDRLDGDIDQQTATWVGAYITVVE